MLYKLCNFIKESNVCCIGAIRFVGKLCLITKLRNFKFEKVVKFYVHISTVFSCRVTNSLYYNFNAIAAVVIHNQS